MCFGQSCLRLIFQTPDVSEDSNNNKFSSHLPIGPRHGALARSPPKHSLPPRATLPPSLHDPLISSPSSCRPSLGVRTTLTFQAPSSVPPPKGDTLAPAPRHLPRAQSVAPKWLPRRPRLRQDHHFLLHFSSEKKYLKFSKKKKHRFVYMRARVLLRYPNASSNHCDRLRHKPTTYSS